MLPHRAARDCNALTRNELKNSQDDLPENKRSTNGALNFCLTYYLPQNIKRTKRAEICKLRFQVTRSTIRNSITQQLGSYPVTPVAYLPQESSIPHKPGQIVTSETGKYSRALPATYVHASYSLSTKSFWLNKIES